MPSPPTSSVDRAAPVAPDAESAHAGQTGIDSRLEAMEASESLTHRRADLPFSLYDRKVTRLSTTDGPGIECPLCARMTGVPTLAIEGLDSRVAVCKECGFGFMHPLPTPEEIATFYPQEYYGSTGRKFTGIVEFAVRLVARRHVRFLARMVPEAGRVLDVGCGRGVLLKELADQGLEVHGFEVSPSAAIGVDPRIQLRIGNDLRDVDFPEGYFDQVIIWHVLEHVSDPRATLAEIHRILKPGGEIVVAVPNFSSLQARWSGPAWFHLDLPRHLYHFPVAGLATLLEECGFRVESAHHFSLRQNPFGWVQSALNKLSWLPRNGLYELLHKRTGDKPAFGLLTRCVLYTAFLLGMPISLAVEIVAALFRAGATVHLVAKAQ